MKPSYLAPALALLLCTSCSRTDFPDGIVSQTFVHKYGFDVSSSEWTERQEDGQVITTLANGVKVTQNYSEGNLNGPTTHTFPRSSQVEKLQLYDQGTLLKETLYDQQGVPVREESYEFDDRRIITLWDQKGVPLSIEEYDGELLIEGKYYTAEHELEGKIEQGYGERIQRNREGLLLSKDQIEQGILIQRITYHPNGQAQTISHYHDYQLHGEQQKFSSLGRPLLELNWNHGVLDGVKSIFRNGIKVAEVPYVDGVRHGMETHYDDLGNLIAEIPWRNDKKHGCSKNYSEESSDFHWFFNGRAVTASRFEFLQDRERMIAEFHGIQLDEEIDTTESIQ
ncbi:MAG TPA: hypothetical protein VJK48_04315 [Chlamydiales bacterium]|nr:hypothetical protein [Chlamydiales bacterium]